MRIFPFLTTIQRQLIHLESAYLNGKPVVFDIHPNEFIDESNEKRIIHSRSKNKISYFMQDWLRAKLKTKNLGVNCIAYFEREIEFYKNRNYEFLTVKDFCKKEGLLK